MTGTRRDRWAAAAGRWRRARMIGPGRRGLAAAVFSLTFPVIAAIGVATFAGLAWLSFDARRTALRDRTATLAELTALSLTVPVWNFDRRAYSRQIRALARDPEFAYARLDGQDGAPLIAHGTPPPADRSGVIVATAEVFAPDRPEPIGRLTLALATATLHRDTRDQLAIGAAALVAMVVALSLALHLGVRQLVERPVVRLLAAMRRVEHKDWQTVPTTRQDELGRLTRGFNAMVAGLKAGDEAKRLAAALAEANREIAESLAYARRIQAAVLPASDALAGAGAEVAVLWEPVATVGGDVYWLERFGDRCLVLLADCTGHGVPGALMTLLVAGALDHHLRTEGLTTPAALLAALDRAVRDRLSGADDGFEAAACVWDVADRALTIASAGVPLYVVEGDRVQALRGTRTALGYCSLAPRLPVPEHRVSLPPGATAYLVSDGVTDLVGGDPPGLLGRRRLGELLRGGGAGPPAVQLDRLVGALCRFRGAEPVRDDMTVIAFRAAAFAPCDAGVRPDGRAGGAAPSDPRKGVAPLDPHFNGVQGAPPGRGVSGGETP